ncbi:GTP-binding protein Di-Ras1 [Cricetulus griseus]|nr:GTP-binding protein Di-Ras1 [Cricetulus griseus]
MTKLLVAKVLCMVGVFFFMLLGSLLPVKVIEADFEKAHRSKKVLSLCNTFGGGVFLATCFNALLPAVRDKLQQVLSLGHISTDYPLAETLMMVGFFLTVFVEQLGRSGVLAAGPVRPAGFEKMPEQSNDYRVVVFGAGGVGKSSLVLRFVKGTFRDTYIPTIEDTYRQVISCDKSVCTLQITDTTGSHQFPAMQRLSISKGHAFILVFSVTSKQSLDELSPIYKLIVQIKGSVEDIPIMLVGNKCDETQREVHTREAQAVAQEWKCAFMETSAKMNYNVKELFQELLTLETRRSVSLSVDGKRSSKQKRADRIKGKCALM